MAAEKQREREREKKKKKGSGTSYSPKDLTPRDLLPPERPPYYFLKFLL
jgi:hypothetical protein